MAHYEDLNLCDYFGPTEGRLLAVGWLHPGHPFSEGRVSRPFFETLARLLAKWAQWGVLQALDRQVRLDDLQGLPCEYWFPLRAAREKDTAT